MKTKNRLSVCTDKGYGTQVMVVRKHPHFVMKQLVIIKYMTHELYNIMYEARLSEMMQDPKRHLGAKVIVIFLVTQTLMSAALQRK